MVADYGRIQKELIKQNKQEDFDKKEFGFCLSMLKQKNNEALLRYKQRLNQRPVNIEIDTKIENQADVELVMLMLLDNPLQDQHREGDQGAEEEEDRQ